MATRAKNEKLADQPAEPDEAQQNPPADPGLADKSGPDTGDPRAVALAALASAAGDVVEEEARPGPVIPWTGRVLDWGGPVEMKVVFDRYCAIVNGIHVYAEKGDRVLMTQEEAERGRALGALIDG
ncbi:hypothetical protein LI90_4377 (plasmid) [Carbonactinospora thermoautotrophica]|uniref:Uncharacterized protein n=1 Tax=Carbonactinospora thermoautotrophica TaxID=1469144 RepID=A0A132MI19_9ACTN|nr:hypothetical protein [Carbonactinospora thermoautotrophica]KWW97405.1 hypothetical protein LI90_4377 [Carbonactinospora thermoautotrophica]